MPSFSERLEYRDWRFDTPNFLSFEDSEDQPGLLGVEYTTGCDNRWSGEIRLGPLLTTLNLTPAGGTAANTNGFALSHGLSSTKYIYAIRGTKWAKVKASDMSLLSDDTETALAEAATDIIYTKNGSGTEEISVGMAGAAYRVITAVGAGATDTHSANNESKVMKIFGKGTPAGVIVGLRGNAATVEQNDISGSTSMDASAWETRQTIAGESFLFTGFATINGVWMIGTTNGPYYFDNDLLESRPLIEEIANTMEGPSGSFQNCDQMGNWYAAGVLIPLEGRLRLMYSPTEGESVGVEAFDRWNRSPVQGQCTAVSGSREWLYTAEYNKVTDTTYLVAWHPAEHDAPAVRWHDNFLSGYVIGTLGSAGGAGFECHAIENIGYYGGRTLPTIVGGYDDDLFYFHEGRLPYFPNDTSYTYAASGTVYFTEMRQYPLYEKKVESVTVQTTGCSSTQTITISVSVDGGSNWTQLGAAIDSNGKHRLRPNEEDTIWGRHIRLKADFATASSAATPVLQDRLIMHFRRAPLEIDGMVFEDEM